MLFKDTGEEMEEKSIVEVENFSSQGLFFQHLAGLFSPDHLVVTTELNLARDAKSLRKGFYRYIV